MDELKNMGPVLERARKAAIDYYNITGKPLGITGEMGEYLGAKELGLKLAQVREPGFDAKDKEGNLIQIKARSIPRSKTLTGQRMGGIRLDHPWDKVLLVLMDEHFRAVAMYMGNRPEIESALKKPGSKSRNERGALAITQFKNIAKQVWP
mgnify:CR=1 FL=1|jgi:hypothetical protein